MQMTTKTAKFLPIHQLEGSRDSKHLSSGLYRHREGNQPNLTRNLAKEYEHQAVMQACIPSAADYGDLDTVQESMAISQMRARTCWVADRLSWLMKDIATSSLFRSLSAC